MLAYKLPAFMDYLHHHYQQVYRKYAGRLTELFPSSEPTDKNLLIADDEETTEEEDQAVYKLWEAFHFRNR